MTHLSDEQMQALLDQSRSLPPKVQAHLNRCATCRMELQAYQDVYHTLNQDNVEIPGNFPETVFARIEKPAERMHWLRIPETWGLALSGIFGIFSLVYWIPWQTVRSGFHFESPVLPLPDTITGLSLQLPLILMAAAIIAVIAVVDAKWVKPRLHL